MITQLTNPLDALAVAVANAASSDAVADSHPSASASNEQNNDGDGSISTVAPEIPESMVVVTKIKRGRPKQSDMCQASASKRLALSEGYKRIVDKIAKDASEDNGGRRRKFVCTVLGCGKVFYQRAHLNIHIRSHTGYKPYACPYPGCGKSFPQLGNMRVHERTHTGDRPFPCDMPGCGKAFTQLGNLKTHMKKVHNIIISPKEWRQARAAMMNQSRPQVAKLPVIPPPSLSLSIVDNQASIPTPASILANAKPAYRAPINKSDSGQLS